jgi:hypothetical protein
MNYESSIPDMLIMFQLPCREGSVTQADTHSDICFPWDEAKRDHGKEISITIIQEATPWNEHKTNKQTPQFLVCKRTIPTDRPPLISEF